MIVNKKKQPYFLIIGLGASGVSMAKFLHSQGKSVIVTDIDDSRSETAKELTALGIKTEIGFHAQETFNNAFALVPSPGIPLSSQFIQTAVSQGVTITGELDIFALYNTLPVIAITGTNGKTTTTTLIGDMLKSCGMNPFVGGNIGTPLADNLMEKGKTDIIVAEISSFQLDISKHFRPDVGLLLNISEDHLDRYENYKAYENSKWSIFKNQTASDKAVIHKSIGGFDKIKQNIRSQIFTFSSEKELSVDCSARVYKNRIEIATKNLHQTIPTDQLKVLSGTHNRENIAAAVLACLAIGKKIKPILKGLSSFKNLPHRMEFVKKINEVSFFNDSKATNTDAVIRALECFEQKIILILGGREKATDFSLLINSVEKKVKTIIAVGESKENVKNTFKNTCEVLKVQTMKDAVLKAFNCAIGNDSILLSPGCASFDMYDSYAQRGNDFKACVKIIGTE